MPKPPSPAHVILCNHNLTSDINNETYSPSEELLLRHRWTALNQSIGVDNIIRE
jgi:hypothetical protein